MLKKRKWGQALRIGVCGTGVSLLRSSRWGSAPPELLAEVAFEPGDAAPQHAIALALRELLNGRELAGWPVSFVLADELTRLWQVTPPRHAARLSDIAAAAALRFQVLYGESAADWQMEADWDDSAPFFAAAVPRALLAVLRQAAAEHKLAAVEIVPHFVTSWNRWQRAVKPGAWFGQLHDKLLTLGVLAGAGRRRSLHAVRVLPVPPGADQYWLTQTLQREALLAGLDAPQLLQLAGRVPPAWSAAPGNSAHIPCAPLGQPQVAGPAPSPAAALAGAAA